ncbi:MAG: endo-1,4-beta-xylanase [Balneola sp.]|nr:MAG: endo-1,4-beta-xylanase [Balneola sp.]
MKRLAQLPAFVLIVILSTSCIGTIEQQPAETLASAYNDHFYIGAALKTSQYTGEDQRGIPIVEKHFNSISPENDLKWERIHPEPGVFNFEEADSFVEFGEANDMFIVGHVLVWHSQTPDWVFEDEDGNPLSREALLERMEDHITTIVTRYKGRINGWDVVNEALNEDGTFRESKWYQIIGPDFIAKAFEYAAAADPEAELYYNDYNLFNPDKADGAIQMVKDIQEQGIKVSGIGMQGHYGLQGPTAEEVEASIIKFGELGIVAITELDVDVLPPAFEYMGADISMRAELKEELNPYTEGMPDSIKQAQIDQYTAYFEVFLKHADKINRVTTWGVTDGDSWKNYWPVSERRNYPLLFDREGNEKEVAKVLMELPSNK